MARGAFVVWVLATSSVGALAPRALADEQDPRPYSRTPPPARPSRLILVGADVGLAARPADHDSIGYAAGPVLGVHARLELAAAVGLRLRYAYSTHDIEIPDGILGDANTTYGSPTLVVHHIGAAVEPTFAMGERGRLFAGLGIGWSRLSAADLRLEQASRVLGAAPGISGELGRAGVALEYALSLGASFDLVPSWVAVSLMAHGALLSNQSGALFDSSQAVDRSGQLTRVSGLPASTMVLGMSVGVSVIL